MPVQMTASINRVREMKKRKFVSSCFRQTECNGHPGCTAAWHDDSYQIDCRVESQRALYPIFQAHHAPRRIMDRAWRLRFLSIGLRRSLAGGGDKTGLR